MLMAAIVMVIISRGISSHPITPSTAPADSGYNIFITYYKFSNGNKTRNMISKAKATTPNVLIWEAKRLWSILLYRIIVPDKWALVSSRSS